MSCEELPELEECGQASEDYARVREEAAPARPSRKGGDCPPPADGEEVRAAIAGSRVLREGLADPQLMAALAEIAADPRSLARHAGNARLAAFYAEYLAAFQGRAPPSPPPPPPRIVELEVDRLLQDAEVQALIAGMGPAGQFDFVALARANPSLAAKVRLLLEKGVFQVK